MNKKAYYILIPILALFFLLVNFLSIHNKYTQTSQNKSQSSFSQSPKSTNDLVDFISEIKEEDDNEDKFQTKVTCDYAVENFIIQSKFYTSNYFPSFNFLTNLYTGIPIFSAVGLVDEIWMMITAVVASMLVMLAVSQRISAFINQHPDIKLLALSFLLLIGAYLIFESLHVTFDKTLLYFGMGFALFNEILNIQLRKNL